MRRAGRAAFTLIEILVALSAGILVSMAAFAMSKNATAFFQNEARISSAQLALTLGLNRITADLTRASFLSTPNAKVDPMVCRDPSWNTAQGLNSLAGVTIAQGAAPVATSQAGMNGITPDQLYIGGSLDASETFTVQCLLQGAGGAPALQLQTQQFDGAMARVMASLGPTEPLQSRLSNIFVAGRYVQILDPATGYKVFGALATASPVTVVSGVATVQLQATPALPMKPASPCGLLAPPQCGGGLLVSVVSRVLYDVRSLQGVAGSPYAALVATPPGVAAQSGDAGRTELVRVEIDATNNERANSLELVSEYAVDLRLGITAVTTKVVSDNYNPTVKTYEIGDSNIYSIAGDAAGGTSTPQLIRAVQVRLAVRTRAPDRETDLPVGFDGRRLHYRVLTAGRPQYARVRTAYANVSLPNQGGFSLW
ncbi:MAG: prepilin-type cleavage/methylation domain-containing protein [Minicystis sp.]